MSQLWVFDFDDTLVVTDSRVHVTGADGTRRSLTPGEFALYDPLPGDAIDYADFQRLVNPRPIVWACNALEQARRAFGRSSVAVLTARSWAEPVGEFLAARGLGDVEVATTRSAHPSEKAHYIDRSITSRGLRIVHFFDDSHRNVLAVHGLATRHPGVLINVHHIVDGVGRPVRI